MNTSGVDFDPANVILVIVDGEAQFGISALDSAVGVSGLAPVSRPCAGHPPVMGRPLFSELPGDSHHLGPLFGEAATVQTSSLSETALVASPQSKLHGKASVQVSAARKLLAMFNMPRWPGAMKENLFH